MTPRSSVIVQRKAPLSLRGSITTWVSCATVKVYRSRWEDTVRLPLVNWFSTSGWGAAGVVVNRAQSMATSRGVVPPIVLFWKMPKRAPFANASVVNPRSRLKSSTPLSLSSTARRFPSAAASSLIRYQVLSVKANPCCVANAPPPMPPVPVRTTRPPPLLSLNRSM